MSLNKLRDEVHEIAKEKGWHETEMCFKEFIANTHGELSEAWEEFRKHKEFNETYLADDGKDGMKPEGIPIELADALIRILDFCGAHDINIEEAVKLKSLYNKSRPYRHGGKKA